MNKIAEIDQKIRVERLNLNIADTPEAKAKIQNKIDELKYRREIERIRDQISKLNNKD